MDTNTLTLPVSNTSVEISVPIYIESRYKVNRKKIKARVVNTLLKNGIKRKTEVSIAIVGNRKMRSLNNKYRQIDKTTNVLSFPQSEGQAFPDNEEILFLGDVIIAYPVIIEEAARENMLVDEKICELVEHGVLHLLGQHH